MLDKCKTKTHLNPDKCFKSLVKIKIKCVVGTCSTNVPMLKVFITIKCTILTVYYVYSYIMTNSIQTSDSKPLCRGTLVSCEKLANVT